MNKIMNLAMKRVIVRAFFLVLCIIAPAMHPLTTGAAVPSTTLPVLWTTGGLSEGTNRAQTLSMNRNLVCAKLNTVAVFSQQ